MVEPHLNCGYCDDCLYPGVNFNDSRWTHHGCPVRHVTRVERERCGNHLRPIHSGQATPEETTPAPWPERDVADFLARDRAQRAAHDPNCGLTHPHQPTQRCRDGGDDQ